MALIFSGFRAVDVNMLVQNFIKPRAAVYELPCFNRRERERSLFAISLI